MSGLTQGGNALYEEAMETSDEHDTVELDAVPSKFEWVGESGDRNGYYRLIGVQKDVRTDLVDWWSRLDSSHEHGAPLTLQDKHMRPHDRNYPTKEQLDEWTGKK